MSSCIGHSFLFRFGILAVVVLRWRVPKSLLLTDIGLYKLVKIVEVDLVKGCEAVSNEDRVCKFACSSDRTPVRLSARLTFCFDFNRSVIVEVANTIVRFHP
jgi:hypothetical protein